MEARIREAFIKDLLWRTKSHSELQTKDETRKDPLWRVTVGGTVRL